MIVGISLIVPTYSNSQELYENDFQWKIPGGNYIDPTSFFSLHGYVNAVFAAESEEWKAGSMNGIGMPGQVLIPSTNSSSFQNDEAIWISSEISDKTSVLMELHLVTSPSGKGAAGPGGLTFVLTEANAKFKLYKNLANVAVGTFWSPFGIHNSDWLGAQNLFTMIPYASSAFPTHFNEKGIRLDGSFGKKDKIGVNYVVSVGNGYDAYDISGYQAVDGSTNKTVTGRISVFPYMKEKLNIGVSFARGNLAIGDQTLSDTLVDHYDSKFHSLGLDALLKLQKFKVRFYTIASTKSFSSSEITHTTSLLGYMGEISYLIKLNGIEAIESVIPKFRYDVGNIEVFNISSIGAESFTSLSVGLNIHLNENFHISSDYNVLTESENELNNNRLIIRATANF